MAPDSDPWATVGEDVDRHGILAQLADREPGDAAQLLVTLGPDARNETVGDVARLLGAYAAVRTVRLVNRRDDPTPVVAPALRTALSAFRVRVTDISGIGPVVTLFHWPTGTVLISLTAAAALDGPAGQPYMDLTDLIDQAIGHLDDDWVSDLEVGRRCKRCGRIEPGAEAGDPDSPAGQVCGCGGTLARVGYTWAPHNVTATAELVEAAEAAP